MYTLKKIQKHSINTGRYIYISNTYTKAISEKAWTEILKKREIAVYFYNKHFFSPFSFQSHANHPIDTQALFSISYPCLILLSAGVYV